MLCRATEIGRWPVLVCHRQILRPVAAGRNHSAVTDIADSGCARRILRTRRNNQDAVSLHSQRHQLSGRSRRCRWIGRSSGDGDRATAVRNIIAGEVFQLPLCDGIKRVPLQRQAIDLHLWLDHKRKPLVGQQPCFGCLGTADACSNKECASQREQRCKPDAVCHHCLSITESHSRGSFCRLPWESCPLCRRSHSAGQAAPSGDHPPARSHRRDPPAAKGQWA